MYSDSIIQRFYYQGREAVIALAHRLEDQLEDARAQLICKPQSLIALLRKELQSVKRTLAQKNDELLRERQLNHQQREIEGDVTRVERDSHNSNLPPSLDLPWKKIKRTRSLRKKTGLSVGGQGGHKCNASLEQDQPQKIIQ